MRYRRNYVEGGCYFFTVNLQDRSQTFLVDHIDYLREAVRKVKHKRPFGIDGWVVLPDHMHAMWTLPNGDSDYSSRWRDIKTLFSKSLPVTESRSIAQKRRGERGIWQKRFWEHTIRDEHDYRHHLDYIHLNPVKHALAARVCDWPYSSFHSLVAKGAYPPDWCGEKELHSEPKEFGERH